MRSRDYLVSLSPFLLIPNLLFLEISYPTVFYLIVATSTINNATEQPYAEVLNMIQLVSEREYLEAVCGDWSDYAETEGHQDDEHDQSPNLEEDSSRKKRKPSLWLMRWVQEIYAYFCNTPLRSSTLFSTEQVENSAQRQ